MEPDYTNKIIIKPAGTKLSGFASAFLLQKIDYLSREIGPVKVINKPKQTGTKIILDIASDKDGFIKYQSGDNKWEFLDDDDEIFYTAPEELD